MNGTPCKRSNPTSTKWWHRVPQWTQLDRLAGSSALAVVGQREAVRARRQRRRAFVELPTPRRAPNQRGRRTRCRSRKSAPRTRSRSNCRRGRTAATGGEHHRAGRGGARAVVWPRGRHLRRRRTVGGHRRRGRRSAPHRVLAAHGFAGVAAGQSLRSAARHSTARFACCDAGRNPRRQQATEPSPAAAASDGRLVAAYIGVPRFADCLGAAKELDGDAASGLSVDGWSTFLDAGQPACPAVAGRWLQRGGGLHRRGRKFAGSDRRARRRRRATTRGRSRRAAPTRFARTCSRRCCGCSTARACSLIPAIDLTTPLPALEALASHRRPATFGRRAASAPTAVPGANRTQGEAAGAHYNMLDPRVQAAIAEGRRRARSKRTAIIRRWPASRSSCRDEAMACCLALAWGLDDATTARFAQERKDRVARGAATERFNSGSSSCSDRSPRRGANGDRRQLTPVSTADWRRRAVGQPPDLQLVLVHGESVCRAETPSRNCDRRLAVGRRSTSCRGEHGHRSVGIGGPTRRVPAAAAAAGLGRWTARPCASTGSQRRRRSSTQAARIEPRCGEQFYYTSRRLRLASFDAQSPFGSGARRSWLAVCRASPAAPRRTAIGDGARGSRFLHCRRRRRGVAAGRGRTAARMRRLLQQLPGGEAEVRVERPAAAGAARVSDGDSDDRLRDQRVAVGRRAPTCRWKRLTPTAWHDLGGDPAASRRRPTRREPGPRRANPGGSLCAVLDGGATV